MRDGLESGAVLNRQAGTLPPLTQFAVADVHLFCDSYQELPSGSANLSRLDTFPSLHFLFPIFGTDAKNFNFQGVPGSSRISFVKVPFGVTPAPWLTADDYPANDFMATLQVQPAGAAAPTLPAANVSGGTPTGGDSFASTFGRALESMSESAPDGSSITPKASPREKAATGGNSDSSSMAGIFLNCFVTNLVQPAPTVALSTAGAEPTVSLQGPESTADSPPNLNSGLNTPAGDTSPNAGTIPIPAAMSGVAAPRALSGQGARLTGTLGVDNGVGPTGTAKAETSKPTGREQGQVATQSSGLVATTGQNQSPETPTAPPVSAPVWLPGRQDNSALSQPVGQQDPESTADSRPNHNSSFNASAGETSPNAGTIPVPAAMGGVAAPRALSGQGARLTGTLGVDNGVGPTGTAKAETSKPTGRERGQVVTQSSGLVATTGQNQSASTPTAPPVNAPVWFPGRQDNSALSQPVGQQVGGTQSEPKQVQTSNSGSVQESGSRQIPQASPGFMDSWPQSGQPDLAQMPAAPQPPSSQGLQASSNPTPTLGQTGQAAPASGPVSSDPSSPPSAAGHPELADFSSLLGKFAGGETNIKVSGNETQQAPTLDRLTTGSAPEAVGAQSSGLGKTAINSFQNPAAPKSENLMNNPAKGAMHSAPVSGSVTTETTWQNGNESEAASGNSPLSSSASTVAPQQFDAQSQPATLAMAWQKDAAPEATGIQSTGAVYASSGGSAAHANLSDSSTSGQGKSGQQSGPGSGDTPVGVTTFAPSLTNSPAPDPAGNLLTAHAPSVPASHATISAPQTAPSSTQPSSTLAAWQNYDGGAGKIVRSASISDSASGAEMHVELRSGALGPLEIHAVVHEGSVGAEIHVQGQEAHTLLAAGLPSLERALGERNLRVENITVYQDHAGGGMSGGAKQDSQSGSPPTPHHQPLPWNNPPQSSSAASSSSEDEELANPAAGLSVQA